MRIPLTLLAFFMAMPRASADCAYYNPSPSKLILSQSQLTRYNLTDGCSYTCNTGYYGDFCENTLDTPRVVSPGPWNTKGYYTDSSILKSMTIDVSVLSQVQYSTSDSVLLGLRLAGQSSWLVEVSLYTFTQKTVLIGDFNALKVINGVAYLARTLTGGGFDIAYYTGTVDQIVSVMRIPISAYNFEMHTDKGINTSFVYSSINRSITACYQDGTYTTWATGVDGLTGMTCGADCPNAIYASVGSRLIRYNITGSYPLTPLIANVPINCLASVPMLNTFIYRQSTYIKQISVSGTFAQTSVTRDLSTGLLSSNSLCRMDVSESKTQFMLVENGAINTISALQKRCGYKTTSPAIVSTTSLDCLACPNPPENAYHTIESVTCEWVCSAGFTKLGGKCVSPVATPCPDFYRYSNGVCLASVLPWAASGFYVGGVESGFTYYVSPLGLESYLFTAGKDSAYMYMAASGQLYRSVNSEFSIQPATPPQNNLRAVVSYTTALITTYGLTPLAAPHCSITGTGISKDIYYTSHQGDILWVGFKIKTSNRHCLWAVNTGATVGLVQQYWEIGGQVCSVASGDSVYVVLCNASHILKSSMQTNTLSIFAGNMRPGYADGDVRDAKFNVVSSIVMHNALIYATDKNNCVIREIDPYRGTVYTVAGSPGVCERSDTDSLSKKVGLVYPTNLTLTPYDGYFLFIDRYISENFDTLTQFQGSVGIGNGMSIGSAILGESFQTIRQFHAPTSTVKTIYRVDNQATDITSLLLFNGQIMLFTGSSYSRIVAIPQACPAGSMSVAGGALSSTECTTCLTGQYTVDGRTCQTCTTPTCSMNGEILKACTATADAYCGPCANKPTTGTTYTGPGDVQTGECPWAYTHPCPIGLYLNSSLGYCLNCPAWSTTLSAGSSGLSQCVCLGGGSWVAGSCVIPSPYSPSGLNSVLDSALSVLGSQCSYTSIDEPSSICPCQPGEYISQIHPKICSVCPPGLYSASGKYCQACPAYQEPSLDLSACRCTKGSVDTGLSVLEPLCHCTAGQGFSSVSGCASCPKNMFKADSTRVDASVVETPCVECAAGTYSAPGSSTCLTCPFGKFRENWMEECAECFYGYYATDPTSSESCVACVSSCDGRKQSPCPTSSAPGLYICSDCPGTRLNAYPNGQDDCATACLPGFYDKEGECVACREFQESTCPAGFLHTACGAYTDSDCGECVNATKPLYFSEWSLSSSHPGGPNTACTWKCKAGYVARSTIWVSSSSLEWECAEEGAWSLWDLFTL